MEPLTPIYADLLKTNLSPQLQTYNQKELDRLNKRELNPVIGNVLYTSGVRRNQANRRMDWALIETPTSHVPNVPPPGTSFGSNRSRYCQKGLVQYLADANTRIRAFGKMELNGWVAKRGRTSVDTSGEVYKLRRSVHWQGYNNFITEEIEVMGLNNDFADFGDSGSFVVNEGSELVGMLIGRDVNPNGYGFGLVSDIAEIERDVKELCGGTFLLP